VKLVEVAKLIQLSYRQTKRIWSRYRQKGDGALAHRGRGRASNRRKSEAFRKRVLRRCKKQYADFGPTLAAEHLRKDGMEVDHETLRRWWLAEGSWQKRRQRQRHRQWRERRAHPGELVQMDGSHHDWFEGRRDWAVLMVMIDDANNRTYARFYESEDTPAAMDCFGRYARRYGLPQALYVDKDSIYRCTREARVDEQLQDQGPQTQFKRAMQTLEVELILAHSPQAKGRVERRNGLLQDRLVKALRLAKITTLSHANQFLEQTFLRELNRRFMVRARACEDLHRPIPAGLALKEVLCWEEPRVVQRDWTLRWRNRFFQIAARHQCLNLAGRSVVVRERLDGTMALVYRGAFLKFHELAARPVKPPVCTSRSTPRRRYVPPPDHPWRRRPGSRPPPTSYMAHSRGAGTRASLHPTAFTGTDG
jgi:transposase-like protein